VNTLQFCDKHKVKITSVQKQINDAENALLCKCVIFFLSGEDLRTWFYFIVHLTFDSANNFSIVLLNFYQTRLSKSFCMSVCSVSQWWQPLWQCSDHIVFLRSGFGLPWTSSAQKIIGINIRHVRVLLIAEDKNKLLELHVYIKGRSWVEGGGIGAASPCGRVQRPSKEIF
jgi:hypothetical protein